MKYRLLTKDELEDLREEFVKYLAANSVTADEWVKISQNETGKAHEFIEHFSDLVFEKILSDVQLMEIRLPKHLSYVTFDEEHIHLVGLRIEGEVDINFTEEQSPEQMAKILNDSSGSIKLLNGTRKRVLPINEEKFKLMNEGYMICESSGLYEVLLELNKK